MAWYGSQYSQDVKNIDPVHQMLSRLPYTVIESSTFIFHSSMKGLKDSAVRNTVFHEIKSLERGMRTRPCQAMEYGIMREGKRYEMWLDQFQDAQLAYRTCWIQAKKVSHPSYTY